jgi:hypothetical protein
MENFFFDLFPAASAAAAAATPETAAETIQKLEQYPILGWLVIGGIAFWGGAVSFIKKVNPADYHGLGFVSALSKAGFAFAVEIMVSLFVGFLAFLACKIGHFSELQTYGAVAVSAHMGTRALYIYERGLSRILPMPLESTLASAPPPEEREDNR